MVYPKTPIGIKVDFEDSLGGLKAAIGDVGKDRIDYGQPRQSSLDCLQRHIDTVQYYISTNGRYLTTTGLGVITDWLETAQRIIK